MASAPPPPHDELGPAPGEEFGRLLRGLTLSGRFHFYIAVCETPHVADVLLDELTLKVPAEREAQVRFVHLDPYAKHEDFSKPLSIDEVVTSALEPLVYPPEENRRHGVVHVLDASRAAPDDERAFRWLFGRMNERRNHVTRTLGGELILLATPAIEQLFVEAAPDFWSIRSDTYVFDREAFEARPRGAVEAPAASPGPPADGGHEQLEATPSMRGAVPPLVPDTASRSGGKSEPSPFAPGASPPTPSRSLADAAVAQFEPFLQFVREYWSVPVPSDLADPARLAEAFGRVDAAFRANLPDGFKSWVQQQGRRRGWPSHSPEELAAAAQAVGWGAQAARLYQTILEHAHDEGEVGFDVSTARAALSLAALEIERGDVEAARTVIEKAEASNVAPRRVDYLRALWWLQGLGLFYRCLGDAERSLEKFEVSLAFLEHLSDVTSFKESLLPEGLVLAAESALALRRPEHAERWSRRAINTLRTSATALEVLHSRRGPSSPGGPMGSPELALRALLAYARARQALDDPRSARAALEEAVTLARAVERPSASAPAAVRALAAEALNEYAMMLKREGASQRTRVFREKAFSMEGQAPHQVHEKGAEAHAPGGGRGTLFGMPAARVFVLSAQPDQSYRDELVDHLAVMIRQGQLTVWHDGMVSGGDEREPQIAENLEAADIILVLLSRHLFASEACQRQMTRALERQREGTATVVPILVRAYDLAGHPISKLQALPRDRKSVLSYQDHDEPWAQIATAIGQIARSVIARRRPTSSGPDTALLPLPSGASRIRVLFVAANPGLQPEGCDVGSAGDGAGRGRYSVLDLEREASRLERSLRESGQGQSFELKTAWAVRASELASRLREFRPHIVHFSGHGEPEGIVLLDDYDRPLAVPIKALSRLFALLRDAEHERLRVDVRLALLNACWTAEQARELAASVSAAIGMRQPIEDETAISFSAAFYRHLAEGETIRRAFELAKNSLDLVRLPGSELPQLFP